MICFRWSWILIGFGGIVACDTKDLIENGPHRSHSSAQPPQIEQAKTLTEIAGRATFPTTAHNRTLAIEAYEKPFVGRYHARISCNDNFVPCTEGTAEYILNLGIDGSAHRSIVQYGKIFTEKTQAESSNANYRRDTWSVNVDQTELVVHRKDGINFYYDIQDQQYLLMNLDKINQENLGQNPYFFEQGSPRPLKSYVLSKD